NGPDHEQDDVSASDQQRENERARHDGGRGGLGGFWDPSKKERKHVLALQDREAHGKHEPRHNAQRSEQDRARTEKHVAALSDRLAEEEVRLEVARYHVPKSRRGGVEDSDHQDDPPPEQRRPGSVPR